MLTEEEIRQCLAEVAKTEGTPPEVNDLVTHVLVCLGLIASSLEKIAGRDQ
jgi:hypothetical protein